MFRWLKKFKLKIRVTTNMNKVSDGHHTFAELYEHRLALTAALCMVAPVSWTWRTKEHHPDDDTPMFDGCFLVGIELPTGCIRYHYPIERWDEFRTVREFPHAPKWDGAGPDVTIKRMLTYAKGY